LGKREPLHRHTQSGSMTRPQTTERKLAISPTLSESGDRIILGKEKNVGGLGTKEKNRSVSARQKERRKKKRDRGKGDSRCKGFMIEGYGKVKVIFPNWGISKRTVSVSPKLKPLF